MTATAKVIQRLEPSGTTCSHPTPDFAALFRSRLTHLIPFGFLRTR